jgi:hypothetical protein
MSTPGTALVAGEDRQYTTTQLAGFLIRLEGPARVRPACRSSAEIAASSPMDRTRYNDARAVWHANIGPIRTPQLLDLHEQLAAIVAANRQDGDKNKPAALVDAYPGLGKTTAVQEYAKIYHRQQIVLRGDTTPAGNRRVPVIYLALTGNTHIKGLNQAICRFYGLPTTGNADTLAARAVDTVLSLGTQVFIIDDIHFLDMRRRDAQAMANHLKYLSNAFPVTIIYIGVGVVARGLLSEGMTTAQALYAQFGRRTTPLTLSPFRVRDGSPAVAAAAVDHRAQPRAGRQVPRHARRRPVRLPLHPQHRPLRVPHDFDRPRLRTGHPHPAGKAVGRADGQGSQRRRR